MHHHPLFAAPRLRALALLTVAALACAACGSSDDVKVTGGSTTTGSSTTSSPADSTSTTTSDDTTTTTEADEGSTTTTGPDVIDDTGDDPSLDALLLEPGDIGPGWANADNQSDADFTDFCDGVTSPAEPVAVGTRAYDKGDTEDHPNWFFAGIVRFANDADAKAYLDFFPTAATKCGDKFIEVDFENLSGVGDQALRGTQSEGAGIIDFIALRSGRDVGILTLLAEGDTGITDALIARAVDRIEAGA